MDYDESEELWCCECKNYKHPSEFNNNRARSGGKHTSCRVCQQVYGRKYRKRPKAIIRHRYDSYKAADAKRGKPGQPLSFDLAELMMTSPCEYCGLEAAGGLDRLENDVAHTAGNCVPCCFACNMFLGSAPLAMKQNLAAGLKRSREMGVFGLAGGWVPRHTKQAKRLVLEGNAA